MAKVEAVEVRNGVWSPSINGGRPYSTRIFTSKQSAVECGKAIVKRYKLGA